MEENESKLLLKGVFDFDRGGALYLIAGILSAASAVLITVGTLVKLDNFWIYGLIAGALGLLFGLIGFIGKAVLRGRKLNIYEDRIEYVAGKKKSFNIALPEIALVENVENVLIINGKPEMTIGSLLNAEDAYNLLDYLRHPVIPAPEKKPFTYIGVAAEELVRAKELYDAGLITKEDYIEKRRQYLESDANVYLMRQGETTKHLE